MNSREKMRKDLLEIGADPDAFQLSAEEVRLLLHIRAIGYGDLTVHVHKGRPVNAVRVQERIDYTKELVFE